MPRGVRKGVIVVTGDEGYRRVAGLPLITRTLLAAHRGGIAEGIVISRNPSALAAFLSAQKRIHGLRWQVEDPVTAAHTLSGWGQEEVIVIPCGSIFESRLVQHLCTVCADHPTVVCVASSPFPAPFGVKGMADRIEVIEDPPPAGSWAGMGFFRCPADTLARFVPDGLREENPLKALGRGLLSVAAKPLLIEHMLWVPRQAGVEVMEEQLLQRLGKESDAFLARLIDRRISRRITKWLAKTPVTPNQITVIALGVGLVGAYLLARPSYLSQAVGCLLFLLSTIIDGCDGEIARLKFQESPAGHTFDLLADNLVHLALFPALALGLYRHNPSPTYLILGGITLAGVLLAIPVVYYCLLSHPPPPDDPLLMTFDRLRGRDFAYILAALAIANRLDWFLWAAAFGSHIYVAGLLVLYVAHHQQKSLSIVLFTKKLFG